MLSDLKSLLKAQSKSTELPEANEEEETVEATRDANYFTFMARTEESESAEMDVKRYSSERLHKFFNIGSARLFSREEKSLPTHNRLSKRNDKMRKLVLSKITDL